MPHHEHSRVTFLYHDFHGLTRFVLGTARWPGFDKIPSRGNSMSFRVFTALDFSDQALSKVVDYRRELEHRLPSILRWTKTDQLHITLKFVGELQENHLPAVQRELEKTFSPIQRFPLRLQGAGFFPTLNQPRIFWIGIVPAPELFKIVQKNEELFHSLGYPMEKRPFQPHITIARFREGIPRQELLRFQQIWNETKTVFQAQQTMDHLTFYQSTLTPQGPIYKVLSKVNFQ